MNRITINALVKRINRKLAPEGMKVVKLRGKAAEEHGDFVQLPIPNIADVLGWGRNGPPSSFEPVFDLERLGRDLGALADSEEVVSQEDELKNRTVVRSLREQRLVADLSRVMTVEKSVVAAWTRTPGCLTDEHIRSFAATLARKRARFAFPDDFNVLVKKLQSRIMDKHERQSDEGRALRALRALREIRVTASPSWDADRVEVFFWFIREDADETFEAKTWDTWLKSWLALVHASGRFASVEGVVTTLEA